MAAGRGVAVLLTLVLAGCGGSSSGATTSDVSIAEAASEATVVVDASVEVPTTDAPTSEVAATDAPASDAPASDAPTTSGPLGGVTIDDPFPAQADGSTDDDVALAAIEWAYRHWSLVDLDPAVRARIVENGEENTDQLEAGIAAARASIEFGRLQVDQVRLTGVDSADVVFRAEWQGGPSPIFPDPMAGTAVFRDNSWRVSAATLCLLAFGLGQTCQAAADPIAPDGFRVRSFPDGWRWSGDPAAEDVVTVPGTGLWVPDGDAAGPPVQIGFEVLAGSAALSDADVAVVLSSRGVGDEGVRTEIGDARGAIAVQDGYTSITLVRADDVLVNASGPLTPTQLIAVLDDLEPIELPAGAAGD